MPMVEIIPAILVKTREELETTIRRLEGHTERVHLDIADGIFVQTKTIDGFEDIEQIETDLKFDIHLMVSKPENHIARWLETPADRFIFHAESTHKHVEVINLIKEGDASAGMALNPDTSADTIKDFVDLLDFTMFMSVVPGRQGAPFVPSVIEKIKDFHFYYPDKPIMVDGGVSDKTAPDLCAAGASMLVSGSYVLKGEVKDQIAKLQELCTI
ncbi:MAG: ribulose-phosphate 3-epimerase [Patescibacteria group bacterium]